MIWDYVLNHSFVDAGGIVQDVYEIRNRASGLCMDVHGFDGTGEILAWNCEGLND